MVGQILSWLIIGYLLFLFPVLVGSLLTREKEKEIGICYLKGMAVSFALFFLVAYVFDYLDASLSKLAYAYAATVIVLSVCALGALIVQKGRMKASRFCLPPYLAAGIITVVFTVFRRDTSTDSVLESALTYLAYDRISGLSPYTGQELPGTIHMGFVPAFYASLSRLSGIHVAVIGKILMPFAAVLMALAAYRLLIGHFCKNKTKRLAWGLWGILYLWIFMCFAGFPGYRTLWEAAWTPECLIFICFLPSLISLFLEEAWEWRDSVFLTSLLISVGFAVDVRTMQGIKRMLPVILLILLLILIAWFVPAVKKLPWTRAVKTVLISAAAVFAVLSVLGKGCIITDSAYAPPDNRYKIDREVMEIRMMLEDMESVRMLAPPEAAAQLRDGDLKVNLLIGPDTELTSHTPEETRMREIAEDLRVNGYEPAKLIQHGGAEGCNVITAYREPDGEAAQEELFLSYGFAKIGETESYAVYSRIGAE